MGTTITFTVLGVPQSRGPKRMKVYELLNAPEKWTQDAAARGAFGERRDPCSDEAVCWCLFGAITRCYPTDVLSVVGQVCTKLPVHCTIPDWNDAEVRTYEDVIALARGLNI